MPSDCNPTMYCNLEVWRWMLAITSGIIMVVGVVGNTLTLLALPYVRKNYSKEFSLTSTSTCSLLLHLSVCDLLYCLLGLSHFVHCLVLDSNPYESWVFGKQVCFFMAFSRNWIAYADFTTCGAISISLAYRLLPAKNNSKDCNTFQRFLDSQGIYLVIFCIWLVSFAAIALDVFSVTGEYRWNDTFNGCDAVEKGEYVNWGRPGFICLNLVVIVTCYSLIGRRQRQDLRSKQSQEEPEARRELKQTNSTMLTMLMLAVLYIICILPAMAVSWNVFEPLGLDNKDVSCNVKYSFTVLYRCVYGINFILYITSCERMRYAYCMFITDMWNHVIRQKIRIKVSSKLSSLVTSGVPNDGRTRWTNTEDTSLRDCHPGEGLGKVQPVQLLQLSFQKKFDI